MHSVLAIGVGCCLRAAACSWGASPATGRRRSRGRRSFVPLWFIGAAINPWIGVTHAGYSFIEAPIFEAPIFLLVFALPTALALLLRRKLAA